LFWGFRHIIQDAAHWWWFKKGNKYHGFAYIYLALFVIHKPFSFIRDKTKLNSTRKRKKGKHKGDLSQ